MKSLIIAIRICMASLPSLRISEEGSHKMARVCASNYSGPISQMLNSLGNRSVNGVCVKDN